MTVYYIRWCVVSRDDEGAQSEPSEELLSYVSTAVFLSRGIAEAARRAVGAMPFDARREARPYIIEIELSFTQAIFTKILIRQS